MPRYIHVERQALTNSETDLKTTIYAFKVVIPWFAANSRFSYKMLFYCI